MSRLGGKVAIVTGGGAGIGRETALLYAEEGAKVVVGDIRAEKGEASVRAINDAGGDAIFVAADVSKTDDVRELIRAAESHYGALHVMTANAGISGPGYGTSLVDLSEEDVDRVMAVNFGGVLRCFKYAIPAIRRSGGGAMTATTALAAYRALPEMPAYSASKGAITSLVVAVAADVHPDIRVNAVSPGVTATESGVHTEEEAGPPTQALIDSVTPRYRDARVAHPRELAHAHLWLASDDSSFVTGQVLFVDGGRSVFLP